MLSIEFSPGSVKRKSIVDRPRRRKFATNFVATLIPSGGEVISIQDDNTHHSEGVLGVFEQPIVDDNPSKITPMQLPLSNQPKSPTTSDMCDYNNLIACLQGEDPSSSIIFIPIWNLTDESCISNHEVVAEFSHHVLPKETVVEMDAFLYEHVVEFIEFAFSHNTLFLTVGSRRLRRLKSMVVKLRSYERSM